MYKRSTGVWWPSLISWTGLTVLSSEATLHACICISAHIHTCLLETAFMHTRKVVEITPSQQLQSLLAMRENSVKPGVNKAESESYVLGGDNRA